MLTYKHYENNARYQTVCAKSSWLLNFHTKAASKWRIDSLRMRHMTYPSLPVADFGYWPQIIFRGVGSDISQFAFERPVDSPTPRWNISKYLPTTMCGLTKNLKNYQAPLTRVRHHIVSSQEDTTIRRARTDYYRKSCGYTGAKIWNVLPNNTKSELSFETFRNKLKSLYLSIDI